MNFITKPRLDVKRIRENAAALAESINNRGVNETSGLERVEALLRSFDQRKEIQSRINALNQLRNAHKLDEPGRLQLVQEKANLEAEESIYNALALKLPNFTHPNTPVGDMSKARLVTQSEAGERSSSRLLAFKTHLQLAQALDLLDFPSAAKTSGSKFVYLKNELAVLQTALELCSLQFFSKHGAFRAISTPDLIKPWILESCGFAPRSDEEDQVYHIEGHDLCLIGTSEIALAGYLSSTQQQKQQNLLGISHCFRTEAGSSGKHSKGLYRLHQFSKVEMFVCCSPSASEQMHEDMVALTCKFLSELGLQWRVLDMPTQELGASAYRKYDVEVYMPGSKRWGEVASLTNCIDYQARRLEIKFQGDFAHTLNGTACAVPRILLSLMETHQQEDGSIKIPALLARVCGFENIKN